MIIKRSSWHYRLRKYFNTNYRAIEYRMSFCEWFWLIVEDIIKCMLILFVIVAFSMAFFVYVWPEIISITISSIIMDLIVIGTLFLMIVLPCLAIYTLRRFWGNTKVPTPSIIVEAYEAFTGHFCPPITFED